MASKAASLWEWILRSANSVVVGDINIMQAAEGHIMKISHSIFSSFFYQYIFFSFSFKKVCFPRIR
jgi:hypothetical protein